MDPAGPLYDEASCYFISGFSPTCANNVDQISTSPCELGTSRNLGQRNIRINPGSNNTYIQPNCNCTLNKGVKCYQSNLFNATNLLSNVFTPLDKVVESFENFFLIFTPATICKHSFAWYMGLGLYSGHSYNVTNITSNATSTQIITMNLNTDLVDGVYVLNTIGNCYPFDNTTSNWIALNGTNINVYI